MMVRLGGERLSEGRNKGPESSCSQATLRPRAVAKVDERPNKVISTCGATGVRALRARRSAHESLQCARCGRESRFWETRGFTSRGGETCTSTRCPRRSRIHSRR